METVYLALKLSFKTLIFNVWLSRTMRLACWTKSLALHVLLYGHSYRGVQIRLETYSSLAVFMRKQANHCCN